MANFHLSQSVFCEESKDSLCIIGVKPSDGFIALEPRHLFASVYAGVTFDFGDGLIE